MKTGIIGIGLLMVLFLSACGPEVNEKELPPSAQPGCLLF